MRALLSFLLIGILFLFISCTGSNSVKICKLEGEIVAHKCDSIILLKGTELAGFSGMKIPVTNSTFSYELKFELTEAYMLIFPDEMHNPFIFFPEDCTINFKLHSFDRVRENKIAGGELNRIYYNQYWEFVDDFYTKCQPYNDSNNILREKGEYYSEPMDSLMAKLSSAEKQVEISQLNEKIAELSEQNLHLSEDAKRLTENSFEIMEEISSWRYDYEGFNYSEAAYFWFIQNIQDPRNKNQNIQELREQYQPFQRKHPKHPYNIIVSNLLEGLDNIRIGGKFIDFTLPDIEGNQIKLSEVIHGKIALIDLWASWCGPCIKKARTMIPVYEEFINEGFTIVGVAGEWNNLEAIKERLAIEKFPWINLIELNNQNGIWDKYGVSNSGGGTFLVDRNGEIIAIDPTAEELRGILENAL